MEAALLAAYQVDLLDLWRPAGTLTFRRVLVLVRWLPAGSPIHRLAGPEPEWSALHQVVDDHRRAYLQAHGVKDPEPHHLHPSRLGEAAKRAQAEAELAPKLDAARERRRARQAAIEAGQIT